MSNFASFNDPIALLLLVSLIFFIIEIKVSSSGLLGFLGICSAGAASYLVLKAGVPYHGVSPAIFVGITALVVGLFLFLMVLSIKALKLNVREGTEEWIGETATTTTSLNPKGKVMFQGAYWDAVSSIPVLQIGSSVRIVGVEKMILHVEPISDSMPD